MNRVGPWFPRAPAECKSESEKFFSCFTLSCEADPSQAIDICKDSMKLYDECMSKWTVKNPSRSFRVAQQYQSSGVNN